jgi:hypothetical protein
VGPIWWIYETDVECSYGVVLSLAWSLRNGDVEYIVSLPTVSLAVNFQKLGRSRGEWGPHVHQSQL